MLSRSVRKRQAPMSKAEQGQEKLLHSLASRPAAVAAAAAGIKLQRINFFAKKTIKQSPVTSFLVINFLYRSHAEFSDQNTLAVVSSFTCCGISSHYLALTFFCFSIQDGMHCAGRRAFPFSIRRFRSCTHANTPGLLSFGYFVCFCFGYKIFSHSTRKHSTFLKKILSLLKV